eukprot:COSAG01_NODE_82_length_27810_cov_36.968352_16_plen_142_part_00
MRRVKLTHVAPVASRRNVREVPSERRQTRLAGAIWQVVKGLERSRRTWSARKPRAPTSTVPIPHDAADELHFEDFLFDFPTHQPSTTFYTTKDGSHECVCVVVNKVFARERARLLHEHRYLGIMCVTLGLTTVRVYFIQTN